MSYEDVWDDTLLIQQYDTTMDSLKQQLSQKLNAESHSVTNDSQTGAGVGASDDRSGLSSPQTHDKRKKSKSKNKKKQQWHVGDYCRCLFEEDGAVYEATITSLAGGTGYATIVYLGYENMEQVLLSKLYRSKGPSARKAQENIAEEPYDENVESGVEEGSAGSSKCGGVAGRWMPVDSDNVSYGYTSASSAGHHCRLSHGVGADMGDGPPMMPHLPPPPAGLSLDAGDELLHTLLMSWYMTGYHTGYYKGVSSGRGQGQQRNRRRRKHSHRA